MLKRESLRHEGSGAGAQRAVQHQVQGVPEAGSSPDDRKPNQLNQGRANQEATNGHRGSIARKAAHPFRGAFPSKPDTRCSECGWWWCICHAEVPGLIRVQAPAGSAAEGEPALAPAALAARPEGAL
jgi:hypothetical protein